MTGTERVLKRASIEGLVKYKRGPVEEQACCCCPAGTGHVFSRSVEFERFNSVYSDHMGHGAEQFLATVALYSGFEGKRVRLTVEVLEESDPAAPETPEAAMRSQSVFLSNLHYFFAQTDGSYAWPNSADGDLLKQAKREIEALLPITPVPDANGCGPEIDLRDVVRNRVAAGEPVYLTGQPAKAMVNAAVALVRQAADETGKPAHMVQVTDLAALKRSE